MRFCLRRYIRRRLCRYFAADIDADIIFFAYDAITLFHTPYAASRYCFSGAYAKMFAAAFAAYDTPLLMPPY